MSSPPQGTYIYPKFEFQGEREVTMKNRYYRLFRKDRKSLILAFDHGVGGDIWINPATVIKAAAAGGMDGILSTYGVLSNF